MTAAPEFRLNSEGIVLLVRILLGFTSAMLVQARVSQSLLIFWAGVVLVLCVWIDAITGWYFRRRGPKSPSTTELEIYADASCFVAAPIELAFVLARSSWPIVCLPVFLVAAVYRLARFQVQGLIGKGYLGLPVTYNGYLFPLAGLAAHFLPNGTDAILVVLLIATSALMVSNRIVVPEY